MSSEAMKPIFDNLTSGAGRRAGQEYNTDSATHHKANSIEVNVKSVRLSTQMHVTDWAELPWTGVTSKRENWSHGQSSWQNSSPD